MKAYIVSLAVGILVGIVYGLLKVRSPAPPVIALVGLAGILVGEQLIPLGRQLFVGSTFVTAWRQAHCHEHLFGRLPGARGHEAPVSTTKATSS